MKNLNSKKKEKKKKIQQKKGNLKFFKKND